MNTCRSCRLSWSWGVLSRIGLASAIRAPIFRVRGGLLYLLGLLAGLCKLEAALNSVSGSATEGTDKTGHWSGGLRASRGRRSGGSNGNSSSSSNTMRLFVFEGILNLLHCQD